MSAPWLAYELVVPLPPAQLSPNSGNRRSRHWAPSARGKREYRELCAGLVRQQLEGRAGAPIPRASVACVLRVCRRTIRATSPLSAHDCYRPRDVWNAIAAMKPLYDALVDAGVLVDDDQKHCELGRHVIVEVPTHAEEGVFVTVTALGGR